MGFRVVAERKKECGFRKSTQDPGSVGPLANKKDLENPFTHPLISWIQLGTTLIHALGLPFTSLSNTGGSGGAHVLSAYKFNIKYLTSLGTPPGQQFAGVPFDFEKIIYYRIYPCEWLELGTEEDCPAEDRLTY